MNFREFPPSREEIISLLVIIIESFFENKTFLWKVHIQIYNLLLMLILPFFIALWSKSWAWLLKLTQIRITYPNRQVQYLENSENRTSTCKKVSRKCRSSLFGIRLNLYLPHPSLWLFVFWRFLWLFDAFMSSCSFAVSFDFVSYHLMFHFFEYLSYLVVLFTQGRRELSAVVHCYGGGSCKITINSATTAGEVQCSGILRKIVIKTRRLSPSMSRFKAFKGRKFQTLFTKIVV